MNEENMTMDNVDTRQIGAKTLQSPIIATETKEHFVAT